MRGRKPKPTRLKIMAGKPGHRPLPKAEPKPTGRAAKPAWLEADAIRVWDELAPEAMALGILTSYDSDQFGIFCTEFGTYRKNPAQMSTTAKIFLVKLFGEFGMGPSSRTRISVSKKGEGSEEERFFGRTG